MCGYITITCSGKHSVQDEKCHPQPSKILHLNSFKSTECLLLSLLHKEPDKTKREHEGSQKKLSSGELTMQKLCTEKLQQYKLACKQGSADNLRGGSCQNLSGFRDEQDPPRTFRTRCYSLERIGGTTSNRCHEGESDSLRQSDVDTIQSRRNGKQSLVCEHKAPVLQLGVDNLCQKLTHATKRLSASALQGEELAGENPSSKHITRSQSLLGKRNSRSCASIHMPVAEITVKPSSQLCGQGQTPHPCGVAASGDSRTEASGTTVSKRLCTSTTELSESSLTHSHVLTGMQSKMAF